MIDRTTIIEHMDVIGSDGSLVGKVDGLDGDRIKLQRTGSADGQHHHVPLDWVERVDSHVHLSRDRAAVLALAGSGTAAAATTARSAAATGPRKVLWPILAALAALLLLALLVSQCDRDDRTSATVDRDDAPEIVTPKVAGAPLSEGSLAYDLERFLGGKDGTPRTFTFDKLNFDSGRSVIRQADKGDLDDIARVFAGYPGARAAIVGYTDAKGPAVANRELGAERAQAVVNALAERGVDPDRIEARTGGEADPVAANATGPGRFENRRTELIILKR